MAETAKTFAADFLERNADSLALAIRRSDTKAGVQAVQKIAAFGADILTARERTALGSFLTEGFAEGAQVFGRGEMQKLAETLLPLFPERQLALSLTDFWRQHGAVIGEVFDSVPTPIRHDPQDDPMLASTQSFSILNQLIGTMHELGTGRPFDPQLYEVVQARLDTFMKKPSGGDYLQSLGNQLHEVERDFAERGLGRDAEIMHNAIAHYEAKVLPAFNKVMAQAMAGRSA